MNVAVWDQERARIDVYAWVFVCLSLCSGYGSDLGNEKVQLKWHERSSAWWRDDRYARRRVVAEVPQGTCCSRVHTRGAGNVVAAGFKPSHGIDLGLWPANQRISSSGLLPFLDDEPRDGNYLSTLEPKQAWAPWMANQRMV
jgi:hypothetical protein